MKKFLNLILIFSFLSVPATTHTMGSEDTELVGNAFGNLYRNFSSWWNKSDETTDEEISDEDQELEDDLLEDVPVADTNDDTANEATDENLEEVIVPVENVDPDIVDGAPVVEQEIQPEPQQPSLWKKFTNYGKSSGRWIRRNPGYSALITGGAVSLGLLAGTRKGRKSSSTFLRKGSKVAVAYAPQVKKLLKNKYFWLASAGVGLWAYGYQMGQATGRYLRNAMLRVYNDDQIRDAYVACVHGTVDIATVRLRENLRNDQELAAVLRLQGQNLGTGITEGAVARLDDDDVKTNLVNAGDNISGRAGLRLLIRSGQVATGLLALWNLYTMVQPSLFTRVGGQSSFPASEYVEDPFEQLLDEWGR